MKLKTRSIFQRYNITDEAVLLEGAERLGRAYAGRRVIQLHTTP